MIYLILTSLIWAFSFGLIKTNLGNLDPNFVTLMRMAFALTIFMPFLRVKNIPKLQIIQLLLIGAIQYGVMYLCFLRAFQYLDAYQTALFATMTPIYVILIDDLFARKFNTYYMKVATIAVLGGVIIYYKNIFQANIIKGFLLVQMADICFAFGQVAYKRLRQNARELQDHKIYGLLFFGGLVTALIATTTADGWHSLLDMSIRQLLVLIYLGAIASGLCFFMWNKGAVTTNTATLAVFNNLKAPLAIVVSLVFFNESTNLWRLTIGLTLITIALIMAEKHARKASKRQR